MTDLQFSFCVCKPKNEERNKNPDCEMPSQEQNTFGFFAAVSFLTNICLLP